MERREPLSSLPSPLSPLSSSSPLFTLFDQYIRLCIGYAAGFAVITPLMRGMMVRMSEREHLRHNRIPLPSVAPFLRYTSTKKAMQAVYQEEGWRGLYRGSGGSIFASIPLRAAFSISIFNQVEQIPSPSDISYILSRIMFSTGRNTLNEGEEREKKNKVDIKRSEQSRSILKERNMEEGMKEKKKRRTKGEERRIYLEKTAMMIFLSELVLYPSYFLYTRLASDIPGEGRRVISSNRIIVEGEKVWRREGVKGFYRGFFPTLIAVAIPALYYANNRYTWREEKEKEKEKERKEEEEEARMKGLEVQKGFKMEEEEGKGQEYGEEYESVWKRIRKEVGVERGEEKGAFSFGYSFLSLLLFPLFVVQVRMVAGNVKRDPINALEDVNKRMKSIGKEGVRAKSFPSSPSPLSSLSSFILPSKSKASSYALSPTLQRVLTSGGSHAYGGVLTWIFFSSLFSLSSSSFALLASTPTNFYINYTVNDTFSFDDPSAVRKDMEIEMKKNEDKDFLSHVLLSSLSSSHFSDSYYNPSNILHEEHHDDAGVVFDDDDDDDDDEDHEDDNDYENDDDNDESLEKLGLIKRGGKESHSQSHHSSLLLSSLSPSFQSSDALPLPSSLENINLEDSLSQRPSARSSNQTVSSPLHSKHSASSSPPPTTSTTYPTPSSSPSSSPSSYIPLLSQRPR